MLSFSLIAIPSILALINFQVWVTQHLELRKVRFIFLSFVFFLILSLLSFTFHSIHRPMTLNPCTSFPAVTEIQDKEDGLYLGNGADAPHQLTPDSASSSNGASPTTPFDHRPFTFSDYQDRKQVDHPILLPCH